MMSEGLALCEWISRLSRLRTLVAGTNINISAREPTVTVMKADSHLKVDPSTVCVSMQTLRARCGWVPHKRMFFDTSTKRHGNSITMLRLLRDGILSIVDQDQELAMRKMFSDKHKRNLRPHRQVEQAQTMEWDRRNAVGCFLHDQKQMRSLVAVLEQSFLFDEARCSSAFLLGHVVSPCLSSSSDEHHCSHSCLGTGLRFGTENNFVITVHLWFICLATVFSLFVLVYWWEQCHDTATSGTNCSDLRNRDNYWFVCVLLGTGYSITILCFFFV